MAQHSANRSAAERRSEYYKSELGLPLRSIALETIYSSTLSKILALRNHQHILPSRFVN